MRIASGGWFASACIAALIGFSPRVWAETVTIETADGPRTAIVAGTGRSKQPTVLVLHGAKAAGCGAMRSDGIATAGQPGEHAVTRLTWSGCSGGAEVALYRVEGAGHQVFGGSTYLPKILGPNATNVRAAQIALALFAKGD